MPVGLAFASSSVAAALQVVALVASFPSYCLPSLVVDMLVAATASAAAAASVAAAVDDVCYASTHIPYPLHSA